MSVGLYKTRKQHGLQIKTVAQVKIKSHILKQMYFNE
jgi:hypothetical protein